MEVSLVSERGYSSGNKGLADKLGLVTYRTDEGRPHLAVKSMEVCRQCMRKPCISRCCAEVYRWQAGEENLEIAYENCLECGVCKIVCPYDNFKWEYPRGGFGVAYKYG
jgi:ferredoxin like protein